MILPFAQIELAPHHRSLRKLAERASEVACAHFRAEGVLRLPFVEIVTPGFALVGMLPFLAGNDPLERRLGLATIRAFLAEQRASRYVISMEAWAADGTGGNTRQPRDREDRWEIITSTAADHSGSFSVRYDIERPGPGLVDLKPVPVEPNTNRGTLSTLLADWPS